jgi:hypothetical protein
LSAFIRKLKNGSGARVREKVSRERRTRAGVNCETRYDTY